MVEGQNENGRDATIDKYTGGDVHIFDDANNVVDDDDFTELDSKSEASVTTDAGDWTTTVDNAAGTTELENATEIRWTDLSDATYDQAAIVNSADTDQFIISPFDQSVSVGAGGEVFFSAGELTFTIGGE